MLRVEEHRQSPGESAVVWEQHDLGALGELGGGLAGLRGSRGGGRAGQQRA